MRISGVPFVKIQGLLCISLALLSSGIASAQEQNNPDHIHMFQAPREFSSGLAFSYLTYSGSTYNSSTGICKALGSTSAVPGSDVTDTSQTVPTLQVDESGNVL